MRNIGYYYLALIDVRRYGLGRNGKDTPGTEDQSPILCKFMIEHAHSSGFLEGL